MSRSFDRLIEFGSELKKSKIGFVAVALSFLLSSCLNSADVEMDRAKKAVNEKNFVRAVALYEGVARRGNSSPPAFLGSVVSKSQAAESGYEAAKLYQFQLKNFVKAASLYQLVTEQAESAALRRESEIKLADILFYDLQEFDRAIQEYSKLLKLDPTPLEKLEWKLRLGKAYYYKGDYFQAKAEILEILKSNLEPEQDYQARLLLANVAIGAKDHASAATALNDIMKLYPDRAKAESLPLMLAVAYEEQRDFAKAIQVLEEVKQYDSRKSFIGEKIRSLKERQLQLPGARGFHK